MKFSNQFHQFIDTGTRPATAQAQSALLDEARSVILNITNRVESGEITLADPARAHAEKTLARGKNVISAQSRLSAKAAPAFGKNIKL
jgi:hypothetical protein